MNHSGSNINIVFIGQNIESRIVFNNALSNLGLNISLKYFFKLPQAIQYFDNLRVRKPDMIFLAPDRNDNCLNSIQQIRALHSFDTISILLYDSGLQTLNTEEVITGGTNVYIHRSHDYIGLKKILRHAINVDHQFHPGNMNRKIYMLSL